MPSPGINLFRSDRLKQPGSNLAAPCEPACLSPSICERLSVPICFGVLGPKRAAGRPFLAGNPHSPDLVRAQDTGAADAGANRPAAEWFGEVPRGRNWEFNRAAAASCVPVSALSGRLGLSPWSTPLRPGRECDRRSRRPAIVTAISLTAAPAAQDNVFWLAGEGLAGEAAASLDPPKTASD
jgi:hypothetical protein